MVKSFQIVFQILTAFKYYVAEQDCDNYESGFMAYFVNAFLIKENSPFLLPAIGGGTSKTDS